NELYRRPGAGVQRSDEGTQDQVGASIDDVQFCLGLDVDAASDLQLAAIDRAHEHQVVDVGGDAGLDHDALFGTCAVDSALVELGRRIVHDRGGQRHGVLTLGQAVFRRG